MSTLENRLGLRRQQCEVRRRHLVGLAALAQQLRADERRLQADIERAVVVGNPGFAGRLLDRHNRLARSVAEIDAQIAEVGDALAAAERELKRHELAWAQRAGGAGPSEGHRALRAHSAPQAASPIAGLDRSS